VSSGPASHPHGPADHAAPRRFLPRLRDTRVRSKLTILVVVPVVAVLALAGVHLVTVGRQVTGAGTLRSLAGLSADVSALAHEVHRERMAAADLLSRPGSGVEPFNAQTRRTDERVAAYAAARRRLGAVPQAVTDRLAVIDDRLAALAGTRQEVLDRSQMPVSEAVLRYGVILTDLVGYHDVVGQNAGGSPVARGLRALAAFDRARTAAADEEAVVFATLTSGTVDTRQFASFVATLNGQQEALLAFSRIATAEQQELVDGTVTGDAVDRADRVVAEVGRSVGQRPTLAAGDAAGAVGAVGDLMRQAQTGLQDRLIAQAERERTAAVRRAVVGSVLVAVLLLVVLGLAVALTRSLHTSLRQLREGATRVAERDLPEAVRRLSRTGTGDEEGTAELARRLRDPLRLPNRDEVGQIAQAFNAVHREAVRVAAEQAELRSSVSSMFLTLARRSQNLVDRMIGELDAIERVERDPARRARLFELDHLATRMRRTDENLLVLAGADTTVPRRDDALLADVLRAARSEVELYDRVDFGTVDTDISVAARAVHDVVRLVAELLDNATRFSPPDTAVVCEGRRIRDYVVVQVEDRGLGLTDEQLAALNHRLTDPPPVDVTAFRLMGLAVVSRLAARHDIRVELRRNAAGGILAEVTLPSDLVVVSPVRTPARLRTPLGAERQLPAAPNLWPEPAAGVPRALAALPANRSSRAAWAGGDTGAGTRLPVPRPASPEPVRYPGPVAGSTPGYPPPLPRRIPGPDGIGAAATSLTPVELPTGPVAGPGVAPVARGSAAVRPEDRAELPIYREMAADWFRVHTRGEDLPGMPVAGQQPPAARPATGRAPLPNRPPAPAVDPAPAHRVPSDPVPPGPGGGDTGPAGGWRTVADDGWARASQATTPVTAGTTRSGLPRRVPQAQLVPGGIDDPVGGGSPARRSPEEVRGLLSAYHRGVQRGRSAGAEQNGTIPTKETTTE
jgi:signal transduction histidine kinase